VTTQPFAKSVGIAADRTSIVVAVIGTADELLACADELGAISEEPDRLTRRFGTPALAQAGELVATWMEEAGLAVRRDGVGNLVGRLDGASDAPPLVLGSHIDTVPDAGRYDGPLGVLAAIAVAGRLRAAGEQPPVPLDVVAFADEEGVRFGIPFLGSAAYAGLFDPAWLTAADRDGVTVTDAIRAIGGDPDEVVGAPQPTLAGYLEVHIEQGPVLEREGLAVGVVSSIAGQTRAVLTLRGEAGHAGTVPMAGRRDALAAAAEVVLAVERVGREHDGLVATVGELDVAPGASNVVPREARLSIDLRHGMDAVRAAALAELHARVDAICETRKVELGWTTLAERGAVEMSPALRDRLAEAVAAKGRAVRELVSGAGHDAVVLSRVCPAAMLFVRCAGGISHDPRESVEESDVAVALDILERVVRRR
jgi:allantoate deiminase